MKPQKELTQCHDCVREQISGLEIVINIIKLVFLPLPAWPCNPNSSTSLNVQGFNN